MYVPKSERFEQVEKKREAVQVKTTLLQGKLRGQVKKAHI